MLRWSRWGGLRAKIIAWSFIPTALVLAGVGLVSLQALQHLALDLVVDRDRELARLSAGALSAELVRYASDLQDAAASLASPTGVTNVQLGRTVAATAPGVFDAGVVALDSGFAVLASTPMARAAAGTDWSTRPFVRQAMDSGHMAVSGAETDPGSGRPIVWLAVRIPRSNGALVGGMWLDAAHSTLAKAAAGLPLGGSGAAVVIDRAGRPILGRAPVAGSDLAGRPEVAAALRGASGAVRTRDATGGEILAAYAPVPGTDWAVMTVKPWADVTAAIRRHSQLVVGLLAAGLAIPAVVVAVGVGRIVRPINELILAAQEVAKGNFGRTIVAETGDEIEELARQFNQMSAELATSYRVLEQRVNERTVALSLRSEEEQRRAEQFRVIAEVGRHMTRIMPVDELLQRIADVVQQALGYDHVGIGLIEGDTVEYRAGAGPMWREEQLRFEPNRLVVGKEGITGWVAQLGEPVLVPDVELEPRYVPMEGSTARSELAVPIVTKGQVIGVMDAQSSAPAAFDDMDVVLLQALANQAGVAIDNAKLYARARQAAVLEERQRVARDLHDSVTQSLYGVTLYGDAASRLLEAGDIDAASEYCGQLRQTAKEALAEMRLLIFELRPMELEKIGLVGALQARLDAVESRAGLSTSLDADPDLRAPLAVEDALYRVAQEALSNALRHARAATVRIAISGSERTIAMEVIDDGVGFNPAEGSGGGMGLSSIRERAAQIGGSALIESQPGAGTRVRVEVPL